MYYNKVPINISKCFKTSKKFTLFLRSTLLNCENHIDNMIKMYKPSNRYIILIKVKELELFEKQWPYNLEKNVSRPEIL